MGMKKEKENTLSKEKLLAEIERLKKELKKKKNYGLVWEEKPEEVVEMCKQKLPVLKEVKSREILTDPNKPVNLLIEGDNYHTLSVLNYTHARKVDVIYIDPPYNTGAKDWKYNNNYVDENDPYRHSKWLSMMYKRLRIAKNLLKQDGVLIVTIDDHELFGLLGILENLNAKSLGRVCICIKPEGRRQSKYIMESHEYALFVTWGNPVMRGLNVDFGLDFPEEDAISKFRWEGLMRRDAPREDRGSDYWYPFYVLHDGAINIEPVHGAKQIWPINTKGIERVWLWDKERAATNLTELRAVVRKEKATIYYKRREQGRVKPTSFWYGSKYNANAYGTRLVTSILPKNDFDYPKSLYSVIDCIDIFLPQNGLIVDFFAGSGTTGHAALALNREDQGQRQFILCTNNENNICTEVCYPRIQKIIDGYRNTGSDVEGFGGNLKYFKTDFVDAEPTDKNKKKLTDQATEMLCVREGTFENVLERKDFKIFKNSNHYTGIIFDQLAIPEFKKAIKEIKGNFSVYVFSLGDDTFDEEFVDVKQKIKLSPIPEAILRVYRRIFK
jgi:adenine-specific DNA-methyltransferase